MLFYLYILSHDRRVKFFISVQRAFNEKIISIAFISLYKIVMIDARQENE
jgi:hypothetical protein